MPNLKQKKKMRELEEKEMRKRVVVKMHPSYPTPNEFWQAVQVKADPMLNEKGLPGMLSGISACPETISKWIDRNCRFAAGPAPTVGPAPTAGSVPATPAQGETPSSDDAKAKVAEAQKLLYSWGVELNNVSAAYEQLFGVLNVPNYITAATKIGKIVAIMQGTMTQLADQIDSNEFLKSYKAGEIQEDITLEDTAGSELTGMAAFQKALRDMAEGGGLLGSVLNLENQLAPGTINPILRPGLNAQVLEKLKAVKYIQAESNLIALIKQMSYPKNMPFKPRLTQAIETAKFMQSAIAGLGSTRPLKTTK